MNEYNERQTRHCNVLSALYVELQTELDKLSHGDDPTADAIHRMERYLGMARLVNDAIRTDKLDAPLSVITHTIAKLRG